MKVKGLYRRGKQFWLRYTPSKGGKQVRVALGTSDETVAAILAIERMGAPPPEKHGSFHQEIDLYLKDMEQKDRLGDYSAEKRRHLLEAFARDCGVSELRQMTEDSVERWVRQLQRTGGGKGKPIKASTINIYLYGLRAFCRWLVKNRKLAKNPALIELGKVDRTVRKNFVSGETVRALIDKAPNDSMRFILYAGFHAGLRKREIIEMQPNWIRLGSGDRRGCITVQKTKTFRVKDRDERTIPLSGDFEKWLRDEYLPSIPEGAPFLLRPDVKHGKSRYRYDFRKPWASLMKRCNVTCSVHDMRRTFVSLKLIDDSSLIFKLAKWTGTGVGVLQAHYGHLLADDDDIDVGLKSPKK